MKILSAGQIREADRYTISHEPVASVDLMERAAHACFRWIAEHFNNTYSFKIFCGTGNNGGDGLALARMMHVNGFSVEIFVVDTAQSRSQDFRENEKRLKKLRDISIHAIRTSGDIPELHEGEVLVDALFGTGLNKPVKGLAAGIISKMNRSGCIIISIDMPSGLFADKTSIMKNHEVVRASYTLSFQVPKLAFFFRENEQLTGEVFLLNIGLNEKFISTLAASHEVVEPSAVRALFPKRNAFSHKGDFGKAGIIAGSYGMMGAAVMAARACVRSGAGLTAVVSPSCGYEILQVAVPEAVFASASSSTQKDFLNGRVDTDGFSSLGIGPGIGKNPGTARLLHQVLRDVKFPVVLDADALNFLSGNKSWLRLLPPGSILTPHVKEFERLAGKSANDFERNEKQIAFSRKYKVITVLKGHYSCLSFPDGTCWFNPSGNPGMAKGGSGDVLTGILTALLAQHFKPQDAALAGVYLHGLAADLAVLKKTEFALTASDIVEYLPDAFQKLLTRD